MIKRSEQFDFRDGERPPIASFKKAEVRSAAFDIWRLWQPNSPARRPTSRHAGSVLPWKHSKKACNPDYVGERC